jgi:PAS domain S-box-containing protein
MASLAGSDPGKQRALLTRLKRMKDSDLESISVYDAAGNSLYNTGGLMPASTFRQEFFAWVKQPENRGKILVRPLVEGKKPTQTDDVPGTGRDLSDRSGREFPQLLLAIPLYQDATGSGHSTTVAKLSGAVFLVASLRELLRAQMKDVGPSPESYQLWMMDKAGTLLYQSQHPEMTFRNVFKAGGVCRTCHPSFDYVREILGKKTGTFSYQVEKAPRKLAAFSTVELEDQSWTVVMTSRYDALMAFSRKSLRGHLTLVSLFVFVLISASLLLHHNYRSVTRVEEEMNHLREKQSLEEKARQSEQRYRTLVETMNDGLGTSDKDGRWVYVNDRLCEMLGYQREEMIGSPVTRFLGGPVDQRIYREQRGQREPGTSVPYEIDGLRKDGEKIFVLVSPKPLFDQEGRFQGSFAVITDITELKETEEALRESEGRLHTLSFQLLAAQEKERSRISRELHDELGQALAVLKLKLRFVEKHLATEQEDLKKECGQSIQYIDQVIEEVRRLSRDLSPSILEDLGLSNALQWLINNFSRNNNLSISLHKDDIDMDHLFPQDSQIVLYRIFQEAFTNIERHSQASCASVSIKMGGEGIYVTVEDNGNGFDIAETLKGGMTGEGMGLVTMRERARMLGGFLEVVSEKGKGTRIDVYLPLEKNQEA